MTRARDELLDALRAAMEEVSPGNALTAAFETPRQAAHGDLACTAAMPLAKAQKRNPRVVAGELIAALRRKTAVERWVESIDVAGPGFINLHLRAAARRCRLMKPGPATSIDSTQRSTAVFLRKAAISSPATTRGFLFCALARGIAAVQARSPCAAWRGVSNAAVSALPGLTSSIAARSASSNSSRARVIGEFYEACFAQLATRREVGRDRE